MRAVWLRCGLGGLLLLSAAGCPQAGAGDPGPLAKGAEAVPVAVDHVVRGELSRLYTTSATLRAEREATVIARTRGLLEKMRVEEGDRVEAGQPLAELEDDEQAIEAARTRVVAKARGNDLRRAQELAAGGALSDNELEDARVAAEEATHQAELAELRLQRTVIRAPFAGQVLRRYVDAGATVADGTAILDLADVSPLMADVSVPERHVKPLAVGQLVRLEADASGVEVPARIQRIAPVVDDATGTVKVTLAVEGQTDLRPGTFVRVKVVVETHPDALVVPRPALVAVGQRWFLFRVNGQQAQMLEVRLGFEEDDRVEVVPCAGELAPGDRVVVVGAAALSGDSPVEVLEDRGAEAPPEPAEEEQPDSDGDGKPDPA